MAETLYHLSHRNRGQNCQTSRRLVRQAPRVRGYEGEERRGEKRRDRKGGRGEKIPEQALMGKSPMVCISRTLFRLLHIEGIDRILASVY